MNDLGIALSGRKMAVINMSTHRLRSSLEALKSSASKAAGGKLDASEVLWFCNALMQDTEICQRAVDPGETDENLENLAR